MARGQAFRIIAQRRKIRCLRTRLAGVWIEIYDSLPVLGKLTEKDMSH